ncbi:MAG: hypothetical protein ACRCTA_06620, partial [Bacilli bacterium]
MLEFQPKVNKGLAKTLLVLSIISVVPILSIILYGTLLFPIIYTIISTIYFFKSDKTSTVIAQFVISILVLIAYVVLAVSMLEIINLSTDFFVDPNNGVVTEELTNQF